MPGPFYEVGRYEVEATSQGFGETSKGNAKFVLKFKILGKIDPTNTESLLAVPAQFERTYTRVLTDNTIEYFQSDLESLGVEIVSFSDLDPNNPNHIDLTGKVFDARCEHENGYEKWSIARKAGESKPVESVDSSKVKALDRMFGRHLKKNGNAPSAPAQRAPVPVPAGGGKEITDDDIPF